MKIYKVMPDGFVRHTPTDTAFRQGSPLWDDYAAWLGQGNVPDPLFTTDELRAKLVRDIEEEMNGRTDAASGNDRQKRKQLMKGLRLIRKEANGQATEADLTKLNQLEAQAQYIDDLEAVVVEVALGFLHLAVFVVTDKQVFPDHVNGVNGGRLVPGPVIAGVTAGVFYA